MILTTIEKVLIGYLCVWSALVLFLRLYDHFESRRRKKARAEDAFTDYCAMCSALKTKNNQFVAGKHGAVCTDCLLNSVVLIDNEHDPETELGLVDQIVLEKLDRLDHPTDPNNKLTNYILSRCESSQAQRNLIMDQIIQKENHALTIAVLARVTKDQWSHFDATNWVWANCAEGNFEEALDIPELEEPVHNEYREGIRKVNVIHAKLELDNSSENVSSQLSELLGIKEKIESKEQPLADPQFSSLLPSTLSNIAHCYFLLGDYETAKQYLEDRKSFAEDSGFAELLLGDIAEKLGDLAKARVHWSNGLELVDRGVCWERLVDRLGVG